jgi:hypothetical protein
MKNLNDLVAVDTQAIGVHNKDSVQYRLRCNTAGVNRFKMND